MTTITNGVTNGEASKAEKYTSNKTSTFVFLHTRFFCTNLMSLISDGTTGQKWEEYQIPVPWGHVAGELCHIFSQEIDNELLDLDPCNENDSQTRKRPFSTQLMSHDVTS